MQFRKLLRENPRIPSVVPPFFPLICSLFFVSPCALSYCFLHSMLSGVVFLVFMTCESYWPIFCDWIFVHCCSMFCSADQYSKNMWMNSHWLHMMVPAFWFCVCSFLFPFCFVLALFFCIYIYIFFFHFLLPLAPQCQPETKEAETTINRKLVFGYSFRVILDSCSLWGPFASDFLLMEPTQKFPDQLAWLTLICCGAFVLVLKGLGSSLASCVFFMLFLLIWSFLFWFLFCCFGCFCCLLCL